MSNDEFTQRLADAEKLGEAFREVSDMLTSAVRTLESEGWTEEQARQIVVAAFVQSTRSSR